MSTKPIHHVEWLGGKGLAAYVAKAFGHREFVWNDTANDRYHRFQIGNGELLDNYDRPAYEKAKRVGCIEGYGMRVLLVGLIEDGHLEAGDYLIRVTW